VDASSPPERVAAPRSGTARRGTGIAAVRARRAHGTPHRHGLTVLAAPMNRAIVRAGRARPGMPPVRMLSPVRTVGSLAEPVAGRCCQVPRMACLEFPPRLPAEPAAWPSEPRKAQRLLRTPPAFQSPKHAISRVNPSDRAWRPVVGGKVVLDARTGRAIL
jgi:hypothetical protein